jgi:hypothetical protein
MTQLGIENEISKLVAQPAALQYTPHLSSTIGKFTDSATFLSDRIEIRGGTDTKGEF